MGEGRCKKNTPPGTFVLYSSSKEKNLSKAPVRQKSQSQGPRRAAANVLARVYGDGAYADIALAVEIEKVTSRDRALTTELVYGVLRRSITIDWIIDGFSSVKRAKMERAVLMALRLGIYQIYFLSRIPVSAAVNESVRLVKGQKRKGFVNAVLRKAAGLKNNFTGPGSDIDELTRLSIRGSHPQWMVKRWLARYGRAETEALMEANLKAPRKTLRTNTLRITREDFLSQLRGMGLCVTKGLYSPFAVDIKSGVLPPDIKEAGLCIEQDEASQMVAMLLAPKPGESVLDACAAPGLKTTHIAQMMNNKGSIIAVDRYAGRLKALNEIADRLNISIINPICGDSEREDFLRGKALVPFDAILVDAPCSGLGVLGRTPDIKLHRSLEDIKTISETQKKLLHNLIRFLKPDGRLVYSVCSLEPEETIEVVKWFLQNHVDIRLEDVGGILPEDCRQLVTEDGFLKTLPHRDKMDGFFAVRFRKRG